MRAARQLAAALLIALFGATDAAIAGTERFDQQRHPTRNEESTPRSTILPSSPAISPRIHSAAVTEREEVVLIAKAVLLRLGYSVGRLDGNITAKLKAAVFRFQEARNLPATGELDVDTLGVLGAVRK